VMVEFHPTGAYKAIMPPGNEWGTNAQWLLRWQATARRSRGRGRN
jgi:hypothetical protein